MLRYEDVIVPEPGPRQAVVKVEAIGLNFVDCNYRKGAYKTALPFTPGMEAAGTVAAVGPEVTEIRVGDRVAYAPHMGAYAEYALVPVERLVKVPDGLDARSAPAAILQGITAHCLATSVYPLRKDDTALVHAAAGDAGLLPRLHQVVALLTPWMMGTHQGAGSDEHLDCHPDECTFRVSRRTSCSRRDTKKTKAPKELGPTGVEWTAVDHNSHECRGVIRVGAGLLWYRRWYRPPMSEVARIPAMHWRARRPPGGRSGPA